MFEEEVNSSPNKQHSAGSVVGVLTEKHVLKKQQFNTHSKYYRNI